MVQSLAWRVRFEGLGFKACGLVTNLQGKGQEAKSTHKRNLHVVQGINFPNTLNPNTCKPCKYPYTLNRFGKPGPPESCQGCALTDCRVYST